MPTDGKLMWKLRDYIAAKSRNPRVARAKSWGFLLYHGRRAAVGGGAYGANTLGVCIQYPCFIRLVLAATTPMKVFTLSLCNSFHELICNVLRRILTNMNNRIVRHLGLPVAPRPKSAIARAVF